MSVIARREVELDSFWSRARCQLPDLPEQRPEAWAFGATKEDADELLALVLDGTKTGTASALWDIEADGESVPEMGELSIILDGQGRPRALIETTAIDVVPFSEVTAEHAHAEGEGDFFGFGKSLTVKGEFPHRRQTLLSRFSNTLLNSCTFSLTPLLLSCAPFQKVSSLSPTSSSRTTGKSSSR